MVESGVGICVWDVGIVLGLVLGLMLLLSLVFENGSQKEKKWETMEQNEKTVKQMEKM